MRIYKETELLNVWISRWLSIEKIGWFNDDNYCTVIINYSRKDNFKTEIYSESEECCKRKSFALN